MADGAYNGLTIGRGQVALVARSGLRGLPRSRTTEEQSTRGGTVAGADDRDGRDVALTLGLRGFDVAAFRTLRRQVLDAFSPGVVRPYTFDDGGRYVRARVAELEVPEDHEFPGPDRMAAAQVLLRCDDPLIYSTDTTVATLAAGSPLMVPNVGRVEAPFAASIPGPCTSPRIRRADDLAVYAYRWNIEVPDGYQLVFDSRDRIARIFAIDVWPPFIDAGSAIPSLEWGIPPGGAQLQFACDTGTPTVSVTHRAAWIS